MNSRAREVVELAQQLGFVVDHVTGSGHVSLTHPNGSVTIASTPSEYRGRANTIAQLERIAGRKLPRPNHRRSHKRIKPSGFSIERATSECAQWHALNDAELQELVDERDELIESCRELSTKRGRLREIPPLLERIAALEAALRARHQVVEPFDPFTLSRS